MIKITFSDTDLTYEFDNYETSIDFLQACERTAKQNEEE